MKQGGTSMSRVVCQVQQLACLDNGTGKGDVQSEQGVYISFLPSLLRFRGWRALGDRSPPFMRDDENVRAMRSIFRVISRR